jgi:hypothetical protein
MAFSCFSPDTLFHPACFQWFYRCLPPRPQCSHATHGESDAALG